MFLIGETRYRMLLAALFRLWGRKLIVINIDYMGLGNRLKMMAVYDVNWGLDDTTMYWNRVGWVNATFGELFTIDGVRGFREVPITVKRWMVPVIAHPSKDYYWHRGYWRFDAGDELPESYRIERRGRVFPAVDFLYERTPSPYLERYKAFFQRLRPSAEVASRVAEVPIDENVVCVQVRLTVDENDRANVPRIETYLRYMRAYPPDTRFFISTLDASFSDVFRREFPGRILELPGKRYRSMVDATADLVLLGRGGDYIVSGASSFGEIAWWLGGCRQRVTEIPAEVFNT
jgi:hypothetical protein